MQPETIRHSLWSVLHGVHDKAQTPVDLVLKRDVEFADSMPTRQQGHCVWLQDASVVVRTSVEQRFIEPSKFSNRSATASPRRAPSANLRSVPLMGLAGTPLGLIHPADSRTVGNKLR